GGVITNYLAKYGGGKLGGVVYVDAVVEMSSQVLAENSQIFDGLASDELDTHLEAVKSFLGQCFHIKPDRDFYESLLVNAAISSLEMQKKILSLHVKTEEGLRNAKNIPMLLIYGGQDALVKTHSSINRVKGINPNSKVIIYDGSGHAPFIEEFERFNFDMAMFVADVIYR
ncbi:TPA: alpha/beta hydrolase, partial [Pseudomonas aeruginosa]|nr:alpha/beta hydrolase [Pseudomonas aeruginosa]